MENIKKEIVKKYGVNLTVYVKLSDETFSQLQLEGINISKKTGFKPLVEAKDVIKVIGEKGVYNIADEKQIEGQTDIVCLMFDKSLKKHC